MGKLSNLLTNPMSLIDMIKALVTAVLLDEESGGGNLSGTLTAGKMPIATGPDALDDGPIDYGVTTPNGLTVKNGAAGEPIPPASSTYKGARAFVLDATANVYGTNYASGGSLLAPVYCNGSNWKMG